MRPNQVRRRPAPTPPYTDELVEFDTQAVPYALSALRLRAQKYYWLATDDQVLGRRLMAKQGAQLLMGRTQELINAVDRVYILARAYIQGTTIVGTPDPARPGAFLYSPVLENTASNGSYGYPGLQESGVRIAMLLNNIASGQTNDYIGDTRNFRTTLEEIRDAILNGESLDDEQLAELVKIVALLGA